jgi:YbgC/YbaW family acyl-CoA thioester hydrolase
MPRVQIDLPDTFIFSCTLPVRASDLNYGAHVGNDSVLTLMQEARILFYRSLGFQNEISFEGTVGQIIADAVIVYKAEAFLGDVLTVHIAVANPHKYGFDMVYQLINQHQKEVARGKTGVVCFDYEIRKVASIPDKLSSALRL